MLLNSTENLNRFRLQRFVNRTCLKVIEFVCKNNIILMSLKISLIRIFSVESIKHELKEVLVAFSKSEYEN